MTLNWVDSLAEIDPAQWDALVEPDFPFSRYAFLRALELSQSVGTSAGWIPRYLIAREGSKLVGAVFAYEKNHSYGEYIFDWAWAEAYQRAGVAYYPKLVAAVPMTPASGRRVLLAPGSPSGSRRALIDETVRMAKESGWGSVHFLFCEQEELLDFEQAGFLTRHSFQFHWRNRHYDLFEDFLSSLKSRKRKQIQSEREGVRGIPVAVFTGDALSEGHAEEFYPFYLNTCEKKGAFAYLRPGFFEQVFRTQKQNVVLFMAGSPGAWLAGSLCFRAGKNLYGRYWGCSQEFAGLHFELCCYRPIQFAVENRLQLFEAGAQGEHKVARGFLPELTYSSHWIAHPGFRAGIATFLAAERDGLAKGLSEFSASPYRA